MPMKTKLIETFRELIPVIILAAFGGFTRTIAHKDGDHQKFTWKRTLAEIVVAIFCGLLIHWILKSFELSEHIRTAAIALAGYSSRCVLSIIHAEFLQKIKIITNIGGK